MARKIPRERYLLQFGLDLSLYSTGDGWGYEWREPNTGRTVAHGWPPSPRPGRAPSSLAATSRRRLR